MNAKDANRNADIGRGSDLQPKLSPPNSIFSSTRPAQFFQHVAGTVSRELLSLPPNLCVSHSMFYLGYGHYLGHISMYEQSKLT